jgi:hypothetical protein
MARKKLLIYDLKRSYDSCKNPDKDKIVQVALSQIEALPKV